MKKTLDNIKQAWYSIDVGVDDIQGTPVPISNTVVKLDDAENTWLEAAWEDREMPTFFLPFFSLLKKLSTFFTMWIYKLKLRFARSYFLYHRSIFIHIFPYK